MQMFHLYQNHTIGDNIRERLHLVQDQDMIQASFVIPVRSWNSITRRILHSPPYHASFCRTLL